MTTPYDHQPTWERPSGVPEPGKLGASRRELTWLIVGLIVFALIIAAFWFEASL